MLVDIIADKRSSFIKSGPVIDAIHKEQKKGTKLSYRLIYIGPDSSSNALKELNIPSPHINLEIATGTEAEEAAIIMARYEKVLLNSKTDLVFVTGSSTAAMACTIAAKKLKIRVAHLEAGIWPNTNTADEINSKIIDSIADLYFTATHSANENLRRSGIPNERIFFVGNTLIDHQLKNIYNFKQPVLWEKLQLQPYQYFLLVIERPENITDINALKNVLISIIEASKGLPVIAFVKSDVTTPLHAIGLRAPNLYITEYIAYLNFQFLMQYAKAVITDSGNLQDETTALLVPCISLAQAAKNPETVINGTNELVGSNFERISSTIENLNSGLWKKGHIPYLWDGKSAERIVSVLRNFC